MDGVRAGDRTVLARAITLVESTLPADEELATAVIEALLPHSGGSHRLGITGVPGVGKSTFIDALGMHLVRDGGARVAVLSVDPSSVVSGGSILGDKTRMERLAADERAFIRPSASGGHVGGVAPRTREAILLCEAAGYTNVFVETVGVGQSETAVRSMTDFFLLLAPAGAGDELQGIKRGILEVADAVAITKADGDNLPRARRAQAEHASALRLFPAHADGWRPRVVTCSALTGDGIAEIWRMVREHADAMRQGGHFEARRRAQALDWMHDLIAMEVQRRFRSDPAVAERLARAEREVGAGRMSARAAAREVLQQS